MVVTLRGLKTARSRPFTTHGFAKPPSDFDDYFDEDFHDDNDIMVGMGPQSGTVAEHTAKLDSRFHAMLQSLGCHENTMARLAELTVTSVQALETLVDDRKDLRTFLKDALGLDPAVDPKIAHTIEQGRVTSAWEQCRKRVDVENTREAERVAQNLPPQLPPDDVPFLKKKFEMDFNKGKPITKAQCPSKPYLELKVGHAEIMWEAEKLTEVTSLAQAERHALSNAQTKTFGIDEHTCSFKVVTKPFGVSMPDGSEMLRARLRLMRNTFMFLKMKFPTKGVLATCTLAIWDNYIEWLFGDEVWNFVVKGEDSRPLACPHQGMVMSFDQACREKVALHMSEGMDIEAAFDQVMGDSQLRNTASWPTSPRRWAHRSAGHSRRQVFRTCTARPARRAAIGRGSTTTVVRRRS